MAEPLSADYLVVGAGAMGMAFVDTILTETTKSVILVDRYSRPGGHWTTAYPFVRLHQYANAYGVNSRQLAGNEVEESGWNKGLPELSSGNNIVAYYDTIMRQTFQSSGRVTFFPKHEYVEGRNIRSLLTDKAYIVDSKTRIVDTTYMKVVVPSMRAPPFDVADGVDLVAINDLPLIDRPHKKYTVIGAGKTGIDAILWLLGNNIAHDQINWIMPRDPYWFNRDRASVDFPEIVQLRQVYLKDSLIAATSLEDLLERLVKAKELFRLDSSVRPTQWHCGTVSQLEFEALSKIKSIVRKGYVRSITRDALHLAEGSVPAEPDTLYVDCAANSLERRPAVAVFSPEQITLQPIRYCQPVFSAATLAFIDNSFATDEEKNAMAAPIPHPDVWTDYALGFLQNSRNTAAWIREDKMRAWLESKPRLDLVGKTLFPLPDGEEERKKHWAILLEAMEEGIRKYEYLLSLIEGEDGERVKRLVKEDEQVRAIS